MANIPSARLVFDTKGIATNKTKAAVKIVVTLGRKRHYYSTGILLYKNQWSETNHVINSPQSIEYNDLLNAMMRKVSDYIRHSYEHGEDFSFDQVKRVLSAKSGSEASFFDFLHDRIENRPDIGDGTRKHHRVMYEAVKEHGKMEYVGDVTKANILDFYDYVQRKGIMQTTVYNYMKNLKVYVNQAIARGIIKDDPFVGIKMERGKNNLRTFLTEDELKKLEKAEIDVVPVAKARDLFVFQCYTGMAYADMMHFDYNSDVTERNGKYIITAKRVKSDEEYYIVLLNPAIAILRKYGYNLPKMSNQNYNLYIKAAVATAGIRKNVSSHSGRHTFAIMALNNGISMEVVAKILGHADIRTTKVYAKVLNKSVEDAFEKLGEI